MFPIDTVVDEIDRLSRGLICNTEGCDRVLAARCKLTTSQAYSLQVLAERGEITMNGLADEMRVHGTTMTRMVDTLVHKGLVERVLDPKDRRVIRVRLRPAGQEAVAELRRRKRESMSVVLEGVSEEELSAMLGGLRKLASLAERWGASCRPR